MILETDNGYRLDIRVYDDQLILSLQDKADDSFQPNLLDTPSEHSGVMSKWYNESMSDKKLCETIGTFIKHHRLSQNKTQDQVSSAAGLSRSTLSLLERGETVTVSTLIRVLRVLDLLFVMDTFQIKAQISPIELAKLEREKRQRARTKNDQDKSGSEW